MKTRIILAVVALALLAGCRTTGSASALGTSNGSSARAGISTVFGF